MPMPDAPCAMRGERQTAPLACEWRLADASVHCGTPPKRRGTPQADSSSGPGATAERSLRRIRESLDRASPVATSRVAVQTGLAHQLGEAIDEPVSDTAHVDDVAGGARLAELAT